MDSAHRKTETKQVSFGNRFVLTDRINHEGTGHSVHEFASKNYCILYHFSLNSLVELA